jgi:hypothetical protein
MAVVQPSFAALAGFLIQKRNLLKARVEIYSSVQAHEYHMLC